MNTQRIPALGLADPARCALAVVDVQTRLGEAMPAKVANRVIQNAALLARAAALLDVPALMTEQYPQGLGETYSEVRAALADSTPRFEKNAFSAAGADGFREAIAALPGERSQVVLVGMEAHVCILQSALDLAEDGFMVFVVEDGICSRRLENYQNALDRLRQNEISVVSAESIVFEWLRDSAHPQFKAVQQLLR